ncbi:MAG: hypothetical protein ACRDPY_39755 [Streptosporangiaceae bacterium]
MTAASAKGKRQQAGSRRRGIDLLLEFFRAAGIETELGSDGYLWINGSQAEPLADLSSSKPSNVINEIVFKYARDKLIRLIEINFRFDNGLRYFPLERERGFAIMYGGVRLALIRATHAFIPGRVEFIHANFLTLGAHWQEVATAVRHAQAQLVAKHGKARAAEPAAAVEVEQRPTVKGQRLIDQLPNNLEPELIKACLNAGRRIRLERHFVYPCPVVLKCDVGELRLLPIAGTETRLRMPFRLSIRRKTLEGELLLVNRDPLPLLIGQEIAHEDAITAWTYALLGVADATCVEPESIVRRGPTRQGSSTVPASGRHPATRTLPRKQQWPNRLRSVGQRVSYSGSFVVGHPRRLNDGRTARDEAPGLALRWGIILKSNQTWVEPHFRGVPDGTEMRFLWHEPTELKLLRPQSNETRRGPGR